MNAWSALVPHLRRGSRRPGNLRIRQRFPVVGLRAIGPGGITPGAVGAEVEVYATLTVDRTAFGMTWSPTGMAARTATVTVDSAAQGRDRLCGESFPMFGTPAGPALLQRRRLPAADLHSIFETRQPKGSHVEDSG